MSRKPAAEVASKERNEYIPSFITKKPFWVASDDGDAGSADYLEHQRLQKGQKNDGSNDGLQQAKWYDRGQKAGPAATRYRKGACENCGAMTHKARDCLSRPRAKGARWTGRDIQADESIQDVRLGWDAKRDRWNGYDAAEYRRVVEDYNELEELKRGAKAGDAAAAAAATTTTDGQQDQPPSRDAANDDDDDEEETKYAEESDMGRHQSTATRNLRLREDTAKYLLNLDLDSARYDPKTRSMVDAGALLRSDPAAELVAQENFMRASGDAAEFSRAQRYAWESQERGGGGGGEAGGGGGGGEERIHLQANPTSGEFARRKQDAEAAARREEQRRMLLERYGGDEHLRRDDLSSAVVVAESERYAEYDESGAVKKKTAAIKEGGEEGEEEEEMGQSKYAEDVRVNNHPAVWGSWWSDFRWGYACCHSTVKNSYCTGDEGRRAVEEADNFRSGRELLLEEENGAGQREEEGGEREEKEERGQGADSRTEPEPEPETDLQKKKKKRNLVAARDGISEEELEAYKRSRVQRDDPMAMFSKDSTQLLT